MGLSLHICHLLLFKSTKPQGTGEDADLFEKINTLKVEDNSNLFRPSGFANCMLKRFYFLICSSLFKANLM